MGKYEKTSTGKKVAAVASIGALVGAGVVGCSSSRNKDWMSTDGAAGRINMGAVQKALEEAKDPSEFEKKVNEIYEGDNPVLVRIEEKGSKKVVSGFEDLNKSGKIEDQDDDLLFSASLGGEEYDLRGAGANNYYHHRGGLSMTDMMFMYWIMSPSRRGYGPVYYNTSPQRARTISRDRDRYRGSSAYAGQRRANRSYHDQAKTRNPQAFNSSTRNVSSQRSSFQRKEMTKIRSSRSSRSRGFGRSSRGGLRGGS